MKSIENKSMLGGWKEMIICYLRSCWPLLILRLVSMEMDLYDSGLSEGFSGLGIITTERGRSEAVS